MFASLRTAIRRLPLWGRAIAWPFYLVAYVVLGTVGWMLKELGIQAKSTTKKLLAPLLWPALGFGLLALYYLTVGPQAFEQVLLPLLALAAMLLGLRYMFRSAWGAPRKKSKRRR